MLDRQNGVCYIYFKFEVYAQRRTWHRIELLAVCYPLSWLLAATVFAIVYFRGGWLRRRIAQCGMEPEVCPISRRPSGL